MKGVLKKILGITLILIVIIIINYIVVLYLATDPVIYYIPTFWLYQSTDSNGSYINIVLVNDGGAKEIKDLRVIKGSDGMDSTPLSAGKEVMINTMYRFNFNNSTDRVVIYAKVDGKDRIVLDYLRKDLPTTPLVYDQELGRWTRVRTPANTS